MLLGLLGTHELDREALETLAGLYLRTATMEKAEAVMRKLVTAWPETAKYWLWLTALLEKEGKLSETADCYCKLIDSRPELAVARFNFACFLRRRGQLEDALREHQQALDLDIGGPEEVLSNMAVICTELRRDDQARSLLDRALGINPSYIPAMYNLALQHEEFGEKEKALELFEKILVQDPGYDLALVRIAHARTFNDPADPVIQRLRRALQRPRNGPQQREGLHFALGKALDECSRYDEAFAQFQLGNQCSAVHVRPYLKKEQEDRVTQIVRMFSSDWLAAQEPVSDRPLIFITGMFRSGSTLFEQVLAGHPRITAGGEIHYFNRQLERSATPFPASLAELGSEGLRQLGTGYLELLDRTFPAGTLVTNKRPDAFAYLGVLRAMFPNARFINTVRDPLDTCMSIYFQMLDDQFVYANDLGNIAHYYRQYQRLMGHWKKLFGQNIFDAVYDDFVTDPMPTTRELLRFLELEWDEACLKFQRLDNRVRTASVWQVREPIYRKSSGRWRHYERHLEPLRRELTP